MPAIYQSPYSTTINYPTEFYGLMRSRANRTDLFSNVQVNAITIPTYGMTTQSPIVGAGATNTFASDADGTWINSASAATATEVCGRESNAGVVQLRHLPSFSCTFQTGSDLTEERTFVGFYGTGFTGGAVTDALSGTADCLGFFYSSTTYPGWNAISGEVAGATQTVTPLGISIAASTRYEAWIHVVSSSLAYFYLGSVAAGVGSIQGPFPITIKSGTVLTTVMRVTCGLQVKTNSSRAIRFGRFYVNRE